MDWIDGLAHLRRRQQSGIIITLLAVSGSAPRNAGTKMLVSAEQIYDTIGGGNLEFDAIRTAREILAAGQPGMTRQTHTLGTDFAQCCGGKVELLFEPVLMADFPIVLFGAGHVGQALMRILEPLPCQPLWLDSRAEMVAACAHYHCPPQLMEQPPLSVESAPGNSYYLVMTHSHELDFELVEAILSRPDIALCGLIGSRSKAAKFSKRLAKKQFTAAEIARLTCPVGDLEISGKHPAEVALSIAAQLLKLRGKRQKTAQ